MKPRLVDVKDLPNANPYYISDLTPDNAKLLMQVGGKFERSTIDGVGNHWVTVSFPQEQLSGKVWVGFNSPQNGVNVLEVNGVKIRRYRNITFVEKS